MARQRLPRHADTHEPGGPDPLNIKSIYVDDRVLLDDPLEVVTFEVPQNHTILELNYLLQLVTPDPTDDCLIGMLFNEPQDSPIEYGWRNLGTFAESVDDEGAPDDIGVIGYAFLNALPSLEGTWSWGRIRFFDYNQQTMNGHGGMTWAGEGATDNQFGGNAPEQWASTGSWDDDQALTRLDIRARTVGYGDPVNIATRSRLTLIAY